MTPTLRPARRLAVSPRAAARLAWGLCALTWLLVLASMILALLSGAEARPETLDSLLAVAVAFDLLAATFSTVGAVVAARHHRNPVAWILCVTGLGYALAVFATEYALYALLAEPGALPGGEAMAWLAEWTWAPGMLVPTLLLLLFPDGRLPSPRWRPVAWVAAGGIFGVGVSEAFTPGTLDNFPAENPLGLGGRGGDLAEALAFSFALVGIAALASVASLVVRLRRSGGDERQQLKWLASGGVVLALAGPASGAVGSALPIIVGQVAVAAAVGVGILKYRLYDIDVVINRTLVYGALTATLGAAYLGTVLLLQLTLNPLTQSNSLAVAVSTLAVAALFRPARARIQGTVDRRFYRRKYDAARTLEAFGARLRDEIDLDALATELRDVVDETMQPAHVSLWLRTTEVSR